MHRFRTKNLKIFLENVPAQVATPKGRDTLTIPSPVEFENFFRIYYVGCASGCVVECRICNWEVAGSFESRPGLLCTKVYSAFHPSGVGK